MMRKVCGTREAVREGRSSISLPVRVVDQLRTEARRRGLHRDALAEAIIANVVADDLFAAVIDR
jgi:hypothetical protein